MSSPILFGPNNTAANLQNAILNANGALLSSNGPKNYVTFGNFENGATTGWSLGTIGTLTNALPTGTPTFGSGAAGTLSLSTVSSGQLSGNFSLSLASSVATTAGNMLASDACAIDISDQAKVLSFKFNYKLASGSADFSGTKTNSFAVAVWDATNSSFIPVTGAFNLVQSSGVGIAQGTFQTNATTSSIRFIVYCANATSGAVTLLLDDIYVGPQALAFGPAVTDWQPYTPTFTNLGTVTNVSAFYRRVGDTLEIKGTYTTGTVVASPARISIPSGLAFDTSKITLPATLTGSGNFSRTASAGGDNSPVPFIASGQTNNISFGGIGDGSTAAIFTEAPGNSWNSSSNYSFIIGGIPIAGWSSNTVMSADSDTRVAACAVTGAPANTAANVAVVFPTVSKDTHAAYSTTTGAYTCPQSGWYFVSFAWNASSVGGANGIVTLYKNGSPANVMGGANSYGQFNGNTLIYANAGDTLTLATSVSITTYTGTSTASFYRLTGPATVAASESVNAKYTSSTTSFSGQTTVINATKVYDTHNAYNASTGIFTAPSPGKYRVTGSVLTNGVTIGTGSYIEVYIQKNGSNYTRYRLNGNGASVNYMASATDTVPCLAGDTLSFTAALSTGSTSLTGNADGNFINIERVGN